MIDTDLHDIRFIPLKDIEYARISNIKELDAENILLKKCLIIGGVLISLGTVITILHLHYLKKKENN